MSYLVPAAELADEQIIKKSRFITYISRAENGRQAEDFIARIRQLHPDARHHCWAYIAGHPTATTDIAFSDDGEPQGTAGKPILNVLQHRNIGEIVLVVVRYFGGIKLGAGGLVRAYSSSAHLAVEKLETTMLIQTKILKCTFDYNLETRLKHLLQEQQLPIVKSDYAERVCFHIEVPEGEIEQLEQNLIDKAAGRISFS